MTDYARQFQLDGREALVTGGALAGLYFATDSARFGSGPELVPDGCYTAA